MGAPAKGRIAEWERYIDQATFERLDDASDKIIAQVVKMIDQADKWVIKVPSKVRRRA